MATAVWLDADPGHDDAIAILLALNCPQVTLLGISTVHGNAAAHHTWQNAWRLLHAFGAPAQGPHVHAGAPKPLLRAARADSEIHGSDGLGGVQGLPRFTDASVQARVQQGRPHTAIEAMAQALRQHWDDGRGGRTTIVATGPQTNLALFLSVYPDLGHAIEEIVFMGGGVGLGNRSAAAEYNILCDPEASQIVLDFPVKKTMIPLNLTHQVILTHPRHARLLSPHTPPIGSSDPLPAAATPLRRTLSTMLTFFADAYKSTFGFESGPPLHDALTIAYVARSELFRCKRYRVDVELAGAHATGETVVDLWDYRSCDESWGPSGKNCLVAESIDVPGFFDFMLECVDRCDQAIHYRGHAEFITKPTSFGGNFIMDTAPNGAAVALEDFQWMPEYETILDQIALTDSVDVEWLHLRNIIKHKVGNNIRDYLSGELHLKGETGAKKKSEEMPSSSPMSLPSSSPPTSAPSRASTSTHHGLVIPPFPKRERRRDSTMRISDIAMNEAEADEFKVQIFEQLDEFEGSPFTIQRVCELCIQPRQHYKSVGKYLRALQRTILVTSTSDTYPAQAGDGDVEMTAAYGDSESLRLAMTPLFSPIPFLHDDARRSRSPSPFELAAIRRPAGSLGRHDPPSIEPPPFRQPLGLVDELDDPKPGHLADHPTPLTAATSTGPAPAAPLSERFVKSSSPESEDGSRDTAESADSHQAEDAEVEGMVLDCSTVEDEDKENRPS